MPPKVKITREEIIQASLKLLRSEGAEAVNARNIAAALNCSTQPIFSNFASMEDLQKALVEAAYGLYFAYLQKEAQSGKYPQYKSFGMAYIRFADEEKELFKLLFMCDRGGEDIIPTDDFKASVEMIMKANNFSREKAGLMHLEMWAFVHGIAVMLATSFFSPEWSLISDMLSDIYQGLCIRHLEGNK